MLAGAWLLGPTALEAQAPVVLVCQDGTTQPGSSKVACADHQGMDWDATRSWSEMRAGHFAQTDSVVCTDGQRQAAARNACRRHGGVDSVSTIAAIRNRAKAARYEARGEASADSVRRDSTKWGYPVNRNPQEQNPPGYRGMERPAGLNSDSAAMDSSSAGATYRSDTTRGVTDRSDTTRGVTDRSDTTHGTPGMSRSDTGASSMSRSDTGATVRDTSDVVHRQRSVPPGTAAPPPPYPADSEKVWVKTKPQGDSVGVPDSGMRSDSAQ